MVMVDALSAHGRVAASAGGPPILSPLPSPAYRGALAARVRDGIAATPTALRPATLDIFGRLGLALASRPAPVQPLSRPELERFAGEALSNERLAVACSTGLLEAADGHWRPINRARHCWLAGRYLARSEELQPLIAHAVRGDLADVVGIASALLPADASADLVGQLVKRQADGDIERGLAREAAMRCVAWGATPSPAHASGLLTMAVDWTELGAWGPQLDVATAFLATTATLPHLRTVVRQHCTTRLSALFDHIRADPARANHPIMLAAIDSNLAVIVAADHADDDFANVDALVTEAGALSSMLASHVGHAVSRVAMSTAPVHAPALVRLLDRWARRPNSARDAALDGLGQRTPAGELRVTARLKAAVGPPVEAVDQHSDAQRHDGDASTSQNSQRALVEAARAACLVTARWSPTPPGLMPVLEELARHGAEPDLRIAALRALDTPVSDPNAELQLSLAAELDEPEPGRRAVAVYAALSMGSTRADVVAMALGLVANGAPSSLVGAALGRALWRHPALVAGFDDTWQLFDDEPRMVLASLACIEEIGVEWRRALDGRDGPAGHDGCKAVVTVLRGFATRHLGHTEPEVAALAASALGAIAPRDEWAARALRTAIESEREPTRRAPLVSALGRLGNSDNSDDSDANTDTIAFLGQLAATAPPEVATAAAEGLISMLTCADDVEPLVAYLDSFIARAEFEVAPVPKLEQLVRRIKTLPLLSRLDEGHVSVS